MTGKLEDKVGRGSKAKKPEMFAGPDTAQMIRPVADYAGAEERSRIFIGEDRWNSVGIIFLNDSVFRVSAVGVIAGKLSMLTEIFQAAAAVVTGAIGRVKPRDSYPVSLLPFLHTSTDCVHYSNDLMAWNERQPGQGKFPFDNMQIGVADSADADAHTYFAGTKQRGGYIFEAERSLIGERGFMQHHGAHKVI